MAQALVRVHPDFRGLPTASSPGQRPATAPVLSSRPPTLTWKPPSTQSPFTQAWCYLPWGDVLRLLRGYYSSFFAPTDSCADPAGSPLLRFFTSFQESLQVATSPCCQRHLPDSISANLSPDAWPPAPTGPIECSYLFLPRCHRPSPRHSWVGFPLDPRTRLFRGLVVEVADIPLCSGL
jgi:hypothetical protein